jgi:2-polyprenyl-3-methyl-5-hydroxy-6-metoxy-1,4-benzoquinol methylase
MAQTRIPREQQPGDTTEEWRDSYTRVEKDLLRNPQATNRHRLGLLGFDALPHDTRILDVGAGDGNLFTTMCDLGYVNVWSLEFQPELALLHPGRGRRIVIASATHIPFPTASMAAVIVMDVLHHLSQAQLVSALRETRRVLKTGGTLFVCEPANTLFRRALTILLMSPLSRVSQFSRDKRTMVEQERGTLEPWLESEQAFPSRMQSGGFRPELFKRAWLHHYGRFRAV